MDKIRKIENLYLICWLIKDMCWMMGFKSIAVFMILPTLLMAFYVMFHSNKNIGFLTVNIAMICWIAANSAWMLHDFYKMLPILVSQVLFAVGMVAMLIYVWVTFVVKSA